MASLTSPCYSYLPRMDGSCRNCGWTHSSAEPHLVHEPLAPHLDHAPYPCDHFYWRTGETEGVCAACGWRIHEHELDAVHGTVLDSFDAAPVMTNACEHFTPGPSDFCAQCGWDRLAHTMPRFVEIPAAAPETPLSDELVMEKLDSYDIFGWQFRRLAQMAVRNLAPSPARSGALMRLLEAHDAFLRCQDS